MVSVNYTSSFEERLEIINIENAELLLEEDGSLKIQLASDIHLEFYESVTKLPKNIVIPSCKILALNGDIGSPFEENYSYFLNTMASKFELVLVISGNHEYYNDDEVEEKITIEETDAAIEEICSKNDNLIFLQKKQLNIQNYSILGCTLWGHILNSKRKRLEQILSDWSMINVEKHRSFTVEDMNLLHEDHRSFLEKNVQRCFNEGKKIILLTHYGLTTKTTKSGCGWSTELKDQLLINSENTQIESEFPNKKRKLNKNEIKIENNDPNKEKIGVL